MTQTLEELIKIWDGQAVVTHYDAPTGTWIFIAIHDLTLGMGCGGCRMKVYPTPTDGLRDALRLARGMTHKWAAVDMDFGGGKTVLAQLDDVLEIPGEQEKLIWAIAPSISSGNTPLRL